MQAEFTFLIMKGATLTVRNVFILLFCCFFCYLLLYCAVPHYCYGRQLECKLVLYFVNTFVVVFTVLMGKFHFEVSLGIVLTAT